MKTVAEENLKFTIKNINKERSPYGMTTIDAVEEETNIDVKIEIPNCNSSNKKYIREELVRNYKSKTKQSVNIDNNIKVGDTL